MAYLTYRIDGSTSVPTQVNIADLAVNDFLTNDQINKNFYSLNIDLQQAKVDALNNAIAFAVALGG